MQNTFTLKVTTKDSQWSIKKVTEKGFETTIALGHFSSVDSQTVITYNAIGTENEELIYLLVEAGVNGNL